MQALIRAEARKLLTIRSTYALAIVALLLAGLMAASFWLFGDRSQAMNPTIVGDAIYKATMVSSIFLSIIAILLVTHEYHYNTITYTLTASNSRPKVLLAKLLVVVGFTALTTLVIVVVAAVLAWMGLNFAYDTVVPQQLHVWDIAWRAVFYVVGYAVLAMIIAFLLRQVVGAVVVFLVLPSIGETLLGLLLKANIKYLPFNALQQVFASTTFSSGQAALIVLGWIVAGLLVAWWLFMERDAS